jgi:hypothetical protein
MPTTTFHIAAYNIAAGTVTNGDMTAQLDGALGVSNNHFRLIDQMNLVGAAFLSASATRARLDSPTIRIPGNPFILPVEVNTLPSDRQKLMDLSFAPYALPPREEIAVQATISTNVGANAFLWLSLQKIPIPQSRVQWVRLTSSTAAVSLAWTQLTYTLDQALPVGWWCMVGSEVQSTNAIAHRWIFPGSYYRPGFLSRTAEGNRSYDWNYYGTLGEMGRFLNDNPPLLQVYVNGTDASHVGYIGLIPVAGP